MPLYVDPIPKQAVGVPFTITGSYDCAAPPLQYSDNNGVFKATSPTGTRVVWRFVHPGLNAGTWIIKVRYPNTAFIVSASVVVGPGAIAQGVGVARGQGAASAKAVISSGVTSPFARDFASPPF